MKNSMLAAAGMTASLLMAMAVPAVMPNLVLAQADIRQEDRQQDRQQDRRDNNRANTGGELRGLDRANQVAGERGQQGRDNAAVVQSEHPTHSERVERMQRLERPERPQRPDWPERPERAGRN